MKKMLVAVAVAVFLMSISSAIAFAEEPFFFWEIDIPAVSPQYRVVDCNFYLSASEEAWVEVEYDSSQIGDTSAIRSKFHLLKGLRSASSFILFPEQSGYFTATVRVEGEDEIAATFSKWIMVDPDPDSVLEVFPYWYDRVPTVRIQSRVETSPDGIWTILRKADEPHSGPVVVAYDGPGSFYSIINLTGRIRSIRGGNSIEFVPGERYTVQLWREPYEVGPPYLMGQPVDEQEFVIPVRKRFFLPIFAK